MRWKINPIFLVLETERRVNMATLTKTAYMDPNSTPKRPRNVIMSFINVLSIGKF